MTFYTVASRFWHHVFMILINIKLLKPMQFM